MPYPCCPEFENYAKNFHKNGFGIYSPSFKPRPETGTCGALLLYQTADEEAAETGAVRIRYCPWCGAGLNGQLVS